MFCFSRESLYRLLPQTTTENISKNFEQYTIDPASRYPNLNSTCVRPHQVGTSAAFVVLADCIMQKQNVKLMGASVANGIFETRHCV